MDKTYLHLLEILYKENKLLNRLTGPIIWLTKSHTSSGMSVCCSLLMMEDELSRVINFNIWNVRFCEEVMDILSLFI